MPDVAFVMSAEQPYPLRELAAALRYELERQAVTTSLHLGAFPEQRPDRVYVLLDPRAYGAIEGEQALPDDAILRRTIFLCVEPPPTSESGEHHALLRRAGAVFAIDQRAVVAMHRLGIPARLIRPGYSQSLDHFDQQASRPIDVVFLGTHSLRRTKYLSRAARVLSRYNCVLQISDDAAVSGDTSSFLAESRWPLLAQTKIVINIHRGDETRLEWRRVLDAIHAGAVVVSEHSSGIAPLVAGEHLLVASADSLPYVAEAVLRDEQRLARLRAQAYERLSAWIPYALPVSVLRAAVVELVGEPAPTGASHGALRPRPASVNSDGTVTALAAGDGTEVEVANIDTTQAELVCESRAWATLEAPSVTVVTALRGDLAEAIATLDSAAASRLRGCELVAVATGSDVSAPVKEWMTDHPHVPARLLLQLVDGGLGAARNVGVEGSRAPLCLILDAGQGVYPRCLEVLVATLDATPELAFAYPIQEVTGAPDEFVQAGGDYLLSFLGWEPDRLRHGNHIHAPALIRTERLREVGGFTTDRRLDGFEDYDLWCRMAERGWKGKLVREGLGRRSESGSSPVLAAIHPTAGPAATALVERAPRLMSGALTAR